MSFKSARRGVVLVPAILIAIVGALAPAPFSPASPTSVRAASALTALYVDGGWLASGGTLYQTDVGSNWTATYDSGTGVASIAIDTPGYPGKSWVLNFAAPPGEQLAVGAYPNAVRHPFNGPGQPGLSVSHGNYGCSQVTGSFEVMELQVSGSTITAFAASFVHHCEAETDTSRAEVRFASTTGLKAVLPNAAALEFDGVTGRSTPTQTLTVTARGSIASTITSMSVAGPNASDFQTSADTCTGTVLAPGATCTIKVGMTTSVLGDRQASLVIADDTFPGEHAVTMQGVGRRYAITPIDIDFGSQLLLTRGRATVTIQNGVSPLRFSAEVQGSGGGYSLDASTCASLAARESCEATVEFYPEVAGVHDASVTWLATDGSWSEYSYAQLRGVGVESKVAWGTNRTAGRTYTWSYGKGLGRTVSGTKTYLHAIEATNLVGGKWATDTSPKVGVYYVRTSNAGATWTTSRRLNPTTQHAARSALTASGANVYAAWVSQTKWLKYKGTAPRVLYVRTNTNHGSTTSWRTAVRISSATGRVDYPAIAASGSNVYVAYTDAKTGNIRLATSRNRGATWTYRTLGATTQNTSEGRSGYPAVAVAGSRVIVSWTLNEAFKIVARTSLDKGSTWSVQATVANVAESESAVAATADRFAVAWTTASGAQVRTHKAGAWGSIRSIVLSPTSPYLGHWTPAVALNGTNGTAVSWAACVARCDASTAIGDLVWAESSDAGSTFPYLQLVATRDNGLNWSPSIVWAKADARHVLYERDSDSGPYRLRIRTGTGAPK